MSVYQEIKQYTGVLRLIKLFPSLIGRADNPGIKIRAILFVPASAPGRDYVTQESPGYVIPPDGRELFSFVEIRYATKQGTIARRKPGLNHPGVNSTMQPPNPTRVATLERVIIKALGAKTGWP